jgi:hypothetical protein
MFVQLELELSSDMSMSIYSEAGISPNSLLAVAGELKKLTKDRRIVQALGEDL